MVTDFVNRGVPINGVGFEMHLELNGYPNFYPSPAGLAQNMQALAALGIQVHISEMDVRLPVNSSGLATAAELQQQAQIYQDVMTVCLQQPNCTAFQVWGVSYNDSWIPVLLRVWRGAAVRFQLSAYPGVFVADDRPDDGHAGAGAETTQVVNAAGYQGGAVSPGEIVTIFAAGYGFGRPAW